MSMTTKKKTTIGAVAAVTAAVVALGIGTFAFFSSTGEGDTTTAKAGTLELDESSSNSIALSNVAPGDAPQSDTLTFTNDGSLAGRLTFVVEVADTEDGCTGDEVACTASGELSEKLQVTVTRDGEKVYGGSVSDLSEDANEAKLATNVPAKGGPVTYVFAYQFPEGGASDNAAQGDSATVKTTATLKQS